MAMFEDEDEGSARVMDKNKMPQTPSFAEEMVSPKRQNPFILDDFSGSNAYKETKP